MRGTCALLLCGLTILLGCSNIFAFQIIGPRALGMGGAYVAVANDASTISWNPAGLTYARKFFHLQPTAGVLSGQHVYDIIDDLDDYTDMEPDPTGNPLEDARTIKEYAEGMISLLERFNDSDAGMWVEPHVGFFLIVEIMNQPLGLSFVSQGHGGAKGFVDTHLGRLVPSDHLDTFAEVVSLHSLGVLTDSDFDTLRGNDPLNFRGDTEGNGVGLDDNATNLTVDGVATFETIVTLARTIPLVPVKSMTIGGNLKYIVGRRYLQRLELPVEEEDSENDDEIKDEFDFYDDYAKGNTFGVDVGVISEINDEVRVGLTIRNLIAPKIDWDDDSVDDTKLSTDVRAGVAWLPRKCLTLGMDFDLSKRDEKVDDFRYLSVGVEWSFLKRILTLRTGLLTNVAAEDVQPTMTFGLGVRLPLVGIELAAAANSLKSYRNLEQAGAALSLWFGL